MITYEHPLNERIRTLLRLESLFGKAGYFLQAQGQYEHHTALIALFEILDVAGRADLKVDLMQELERQRQVLLAFRDNPAVSEEALASSLYEIEQTSSALLSMSGKIGQHIRDNEWLMAIRSRASIPGGLCEFDVPAYHHWLNQDSAKRQEALKKWFYPMNPMVEGTRIVLRLLRASEKCEQLCARKGSFQRTMTGQAIPQMVRIELPHAESVVPEVSANKYILNIRFVSTQAGARAQAVEKNIDFKLTLCSL